MSSHQDIQLLNTSTIDIPPFLFVERSSPGLKFGIFGHSSAQVHCQSDFDISCVTSAGIGCKAHFQIRHAMDLAASTLSHIPQECMSVKLKSIQLSVDVPNSSWAIGFRPIGHPVGNDVKGVSSFEDVLNMDISTSGQSSVSLRYIPDERSPTLQEFSPLNTSLGVFIMASQAQPGSVPFESRLPTSIRLTALVEVRDTRIDDTQAIEEISPTDVDTDICDIQVEHVCSPPRNLLPDNIITVQANRSKRRFHYTHTHHAWTERGWMLGGIRLLFHGEDESQSRGLVELMGSASSASEDVP